MKWGKCGQLAADVRERRAVRRRRRQHQRRQRCQGHQQRPLGGTGGEIDTPPNSPTLTLLDAGGHPAVGVVLLALNRLLQHLLVLAREAGDYGVKGEW